MAAYESEIIEIPQSSVWYQDALNLYFLILSIHFLASSHF